MIVKRLLIACLLLVVAVPVLAQEATPEATEAPVINRSAPDPDSVTTEEIMSGLSGALFLTTANDGTDRLFVVKQAGEIVVYDSQNDSEPQIFMDVNPLLTNDVNTPGYTERGLLGLAFHPEYAENGEFYINYTDRRGDTVVARYSVSEDDPNRADMDSAEIILTQSQPFPNHNGGHMAFGSDEYLYIALGDGGSADDPQENGQDTSNLLGTILRIDINAETYTIPADNPFVDGEAGQPEIWSYGLRNPWRFSFDRETGDLWIGDVGQDHREEINRQPADSPGGENYGWNVAEGFACRGGYGDCGLDPAFAAPIHDYQHIGAGSVTGGYVYRGSAIPWLQGQYLFADWTLGFAWSLEQQNGAVTGFRDRTNELMPASGLLRFISSFGEDANGELYTLDTLSGRVFRIVEG